MVYVSRIQIFDAPLKVAILLALPALFGLWLGLGIAGSVLVGVGYGIFTPWVSTFEAFRYDNESKKFLHSLLVRFQHLSVMTLTVQHFLFDLLAHVFFFR